MPHGISNTIIIVPCFNEAKRLNPHAFLNFLKQHSMVELMFIDDGSTDQTLHILEKHLANHERISILSLEKNQGKAEAIRQACVRLLASDRYDQIGFWDCDLSTPLQESLKMIELLHANPELHLVAGSRWNRLGANVKRGWPRHYSSRVFATLASMTINMSIYDTQCGAKMFKTELLKEVMSSVFLSKWLFDIEVFIRFKKICRRENRINWGVELPLTEWTEVKDSKVSLKDFLIAPYELFRIAIYYI